MRNELLDDCKRILSAVGMGVTAAITLRTVVLMAAAGSVFLNLNNYSVKMTLIVLTSFVIPYAALFVFLKKADAINMYSVITEQRQPLRRVLPLVLGLFPLAFAGSVFVYLLSEFFGFSVEANVYEYVMPVNLLETVLFVAVMAVIAPVAEELIFRGLILKPLRRLGDVFAIVLSSLLFSLFHGNVTQILYTFLCGLLLGYTAVVFGSVKASAVVHVLYNLITIALFSIDGQTADIINYILIFLGIVVLIYIIVKRVGFILLKSPPLQKNEIIMTVVTNPMFVVGLVVLVYFCLI